MPWKNHFNPQGSREPRPAPSSPYCSGVIFQSTRLSRASTVYPVCKHSSDLISIHKALASLDFPPLNLYISIPRFQSTRLSRASTWLSPSHLIISIFQSTRLSRASTVFDFIAWCILIISIHKALASLDLNIFSYPPWPVHFNPQGSREPRPQCKTAGPDSGRISIHKALASLDLDGVWLCEPIQISIHKALASLDHHLTDSICLM